MNAYTFVFLVVTVIVAGRVATTWMRRYDERRFSQEETETFQEVHRGLSRLDQRVEALETILMDRFGRAGSDGQQERKV